MKKLHLKKLTASKLPNLFLSTPKFEFSLQLMDPMTRFHAFDILASALNKGFGGNCHVVTDFGSPG